MGRIPSYLEPKLFKPAAPQKTRVKKERSKGREERDRRVVAVYLLTIGIGLLPLLDKETREKNCLIKDMVYEWRKAVF